MHRYGNDTNVELPFSKPEDHGHAAAKLLSVIPPQSYTTSKGKSINNIRYCYYHWGKWLTIFYRETSPLFAVYHHPIFTRKDETTTFNTEDFARNNGNGKMMVDAFFPEVAFKQGKMPKYPRVILINEYVWYWWDMALKRIKKRNHIQALPSHK